MKRKNYLFILLVLLSFVSCNFNKQPENTVPNNQGSGGNESSGNGSGEIPESYQKGTVSFDNQSDYSVNVYLSLNPYVGTPCCTVPPKGTGKFSFVPSDDSLGDVFWFEYLMKIGDATFPYFSEQPSTGYKYIKLSANETKTLVIDNLTKCETKSAYFLLENSTSSEIRLVNASSQMHDVVTGEVLIPSGKTAVYEIAPNKTEATLGSIGLVKIKVDNAEVALPVSNSDVVAGNIYTINVNNIDKKSISASLKAISPFDVDTANKMWGFSESSFLYNWDDRITPVIKPAYNKENGSIMMGTLKNMRNAVGLLPVDQYGAYPETMNYLKAYTTKIPEDEIDTLMVSDFVEQSDGSFVMLLSCWDEDYYTNNMLIAFDFSKNLPLWEYELSDDLLFRHDSANKLIRLEDNKIVIAGGITVEPENSEDYGEDDPYPMSPYLGIFDYTKKSDDGLTYVRNEEGCKTYTMDPPFDNESLFCSVYYDGTNIFASGFTDFDAKYDSVEHDGIIYKFNADLSEPTEIYKKHNCLFFTLSGNGNKWYACGEYWLKASDRLLGCYVSSTMIAENKDVNPVYYFGTNICTWFNQLCTYDNMIVMCGQTSTDKEGQVNPLPFVVAYDAQGNLLWENLSYKKWATALNVIPNTIGTYILQLTDKDNRQIHFVSADFLGNEIID